MIVRTGRMVVLSTARLSFVAATGLAENDPTPEVTGELGYFSRRGIGWSRFVRNSLKVPWRASCPFPT